MITPVLAVSNYVLFPVMTMFVFVCLLLICVVLIQKPKGGGLSGAFGGGSSSAQSALGRTAGDVLTWFTVGAFVVFLILSIVLTLITRPDSVGAVKPSVETISTEKSDTTQPSSSGATSGTSSSNSSSSTTQPSTGENKR